MADCTCSRKGDSFSSLSDAASVLDDSADDVLRNDTIFRDIYCYKNCGKDLVYGFLFSVLG
jgi:hypothetical protein